jgi:hypothetical protein
MPLCQQSYKTVTFISITSSSRAVNFLYNSRDFTFHSKLKAVTLIFEIIIKDLQRCHKRQRVCGLCSLAGVFKVLCYQFINLAV